MGESPRSKKPPPQQQRKAEDHTSNMQKQGSVCMLSRAVGSLTTNCNTMCSNMPPTCTRQRLQGHKSWKGHDLLLKQSAVKTPP